jgi:SagB-type dehydrogenase family enzyme
MSTTKPDYNLIKADDWAQFATIQSDQQQKLPAPPLQQPVPEGTVRIPLPAIATLDLGTMPLKDAIAGRVSRRKFTEDPLTLEELAFLCWAAQGVKSVAASGLACLRTVPSGGARHPFETYLVVSAVAGLKPGLYRYLSLEHELALLRELPVEQAREQAQAACSGQRSALQAAVTFIWTAVPYRTEWRYSILAPKLIAQDSGHVSQNLYLACEALELGTCAVGAYDQHYTNKLCGVDGEHEFAIYLAPVGRPG